MQECEEDDQGGAGAERGWWLFDSVNANSWGVDDAVRGRGALDYLQRTSADVVAIQETKLNSEAKCGRARVAARRARWHLLADQADTTATGYASAGVGVAVRSHFGVSSQRQALDMKYDKARVVVGHVIA